MDENTPQVGQLQVGYDTKHNQPVLMVDEVHYNLSHENAEALAKALTYTAAMARRHGSAELN